MRDGYTVEKRTTGHSYARNGNADSPTARVVWVTRYQGRIIGTSWTRWSAMELAELHEDDEVASR